MPGPGDRLADRYRILGPLGSGGMATVHRAHDERLDRDVAIKVLLPNLAQDPVVARRFEQEARAMATVTHPGLVAVFDVDAGDPATGREPFVVMELCPGGSLADRFAATGRMSPDDLIPIVVAICDALAALHRAGLVHRDVKPANILFASDRVKLGDFGLAQAGPEGPGTGPTGLTEAGTAVGTLAYLSPERLRGAPAGPAADVYALATVAYLGLTGSLPRPTGSIRDAVAAAVFRAPAVSVAAPDLARQFDQPLSDGLAIDPDRRPDPLAFGSALAAAFGRWSRAGRPGADRAMPSVASVGPSEPARAAEASPDEITTAIAIPVGATAAYELSPAAEPGTPVRSSRARTSTGGRLVVAASLFAAILIGAAIVAGLAARLQPSPGGALASGAASASSGTVVSASPSPSTGVGPSVSPSPSASASPTPDPALAALDAMDQAIAGAKGGPDGLKGKEANELETLVGRIRLDLERGQRDRALVDARTLESRARDAAKRIGDPAAGRLRSAAEDLVRALGG